MTRDDAVSGTEFEGSPAAEAAAEALRRAGGAPPKERSDLAAIGFGLLLFFIGAGAGVLLAYAGEGLIFGNLAAIVLAFLVAFLVVGTSGLLIFLFRRRIIRWLFRVSDTELSRIATPLSEMARRTMQGDADGAVSAAREVAEFALARYAWSASRRWVVASLTGLIAALAALAGTTLLFRQNELLAEQNVRVAEQTQLFQEQNRAIEKQNVLLVTTIELTEAQRSAELLGVIADISADLAEGVALARDGGRTEPFDLARDVEPGLVSRIVFATQAARPYRYLGTVRAIADQREAFRQAAALRPDLPRFGDAFPGAPGEEGGLIPAPLSPERGLLLAALFHNRILDTDWLSFLGADFSFAEIRVPVLSLASYRFTNLAQASFAGTVLSGVTFSGATLYGASFARTQIRNSSFSTPDPETFPDWRSRAFAPFTALTGADFSDAIVVGTGFDGAAAHLVRFDRATLADVSFAGAKLDGTTFRGAVLLAVGFAGASLGSADLDGAFVFEADFLDRLAREAEPGRFNRARFTQEPVTIEEVWKVASAFDGFAGMIDEARLAGLQPYRIRRIAPFE